jgi:glycosyltransferase involved in cell wall biosynthesis
MKNSYVASLFGCTEAWYWHKRKLSRITDRFISPSAFLKTKMTEAGYSPAQIDVLPNFMPHSLMPSVEKEYYYCYVGRLSEEKGVDRLLEAALQFSCTLKVIGGGPLLEAYQKKYASGKIEFYGHIPPDEVYGIVRKALFIVLPSVWYENNPFSAIEALCMGTPVLGARIGGIPELIEEGKNGYLFTPGDINELKEKIGYCMKKKKNMFDYKNIAAQAYNKFAPDTFYNKLMNIYSLF